MGRTFTIIMAILGSTLFLQAETVSLSGTVKKRGTTTGLPGVSVKVVKYNHLSATTDANGGFTINGSTTSVGSQFLQDDPFQFIVKGNSIVFSPTSQEARGSIDVFSSNGKIQTSIRFNNCKSVKQAVALPKFGSGINIVRIIVNGESFTRTLICMGNDIFLKNEIPSINTSSSFTLAKRMTAPLVDTLVATKDGYKPKRTPIFSYTQQNVQIDLDTNEGTNPGVCTREDLKGMTDKYIEAQTAGDPTKMPLAADVKVVVNNKDTALEKSIFKQALQIDWNLSIYDVDSCRTFTEFVVAKHAPTPSYIIGTRLRVKDGKITELNAIVTDTNNGWAYNAANFLKYGKQQNWYVLSESARSTREKLIDAGNQYLDIFNADDKDIPWGAPCYRIEGGMCTFGGDTTKDYCKILSKDVLGAAGGKGFLIPDRDFIVDLDLGAVDVFCSFCKLDSHMFRLVNGKFRYVHTLTVDCKM